MRSVDGFLGWTTNRDARRGMPGRTAAGQRKLESRQMYRSCLHIYSFTMREPQM